MLQKSAFLLTAFALCLSSIYAQNNFSAYEKKRLIQGRDTLPYRILLPVNYNPKDKYPLIVFLHGIGERGNDNEKQLIHGGNFFLRNDLRQQYKAIVVFPQCAANSLWTSLKTSYDSASRRYIFANTHDSATTPMRMVEVLLQKLPTLYRIDMNRIYVGGLSMGGFGVYELVKRNPNMFAGAFPICGGADPAIAPKLKKVNWWIFHGAKDNVVPPVFSEQMAAALKKAGAQVIFTLYPNDTHNSWDSAFAEPTLMPWIFSNTKSKN